MGKPTPRKREDPGDSAVWVSFKLDKSVVERIDQGARQQERSRASVIRRLIVKHHEELLEQTA
jgi:predicted transcriptional regulator